jgi:hypothetical protein
VLRYHVSCRLEPHQDHIEAVVSLEDEIVGLGELVQLTAGAGGWTVVVATVVPGAVVEVLIDHGRPREVDIRVLGPTTGEPALSAAPGSTAVAVGAG